MKHIFRILLVALLFFPRMVFAQAYFQNIYSNVDYEDGNISIATADGGYLVGGTSSTNAFGVGKIFLVKTDADGAIQWTKNYGGTVSEYLCSMIQNTDGSYVLTGTTFSFNTQPYGNLYLLKIDVNGTLLWSKHFGLSGYDYGYSVMATNDGGYIIGGLTSSIGAGYYDYYVLKTDANGNGMWATSIGGASNDMGYSIAILDDGTYLIGGQANSYGPPQQMVVPYLMMLSKLDVSGNVLWTKVYSAGGNNICQQMIKTSDGGCIMAGWEDGFGLGAQDILVIKTDSAGNLQWSNSFGAAGSDLVMSVAEKAGGGYALAGYTESSGAGGQDMLLISIDSLGALEWATSYGDTAQERCNDVLATADGGFLLTGVTGSFGAGHTDLYLVKTDASGYSGCHGDDVIFTTTTPTITVTTISPVISGGYLGMAAATQTTNGGTRTAICGNVGISEAAVEGTSLSMVPNPASSSVLINVEAISSIEITDALGKLVYSGGKINTASLTIDVSGWERGVYFVRAQSKSVSKVGRLVVL